MPKPETGVYRRAGSNVWQWRIKAPKDLLYVYENKPWACRCSLNTSDLAEANIQGSALRAQWLEKFAQQRQEYERLGELTPDHGRAIANEALRVLLRDEKWRTNKRDRKSLLLGLEGLGVIGMDSYARRLGWTFDEKTPGASEAFAHYFKALKDSLSADLAEVPAPAAKPAKKWYLRDVFIKWREAKGRNLATDSVNAYERALVLFEKATHNPPLDTLTRAQGHEFSTWLQDQGGATKTIRDRLIYVKSLLKFACHELELIPKNPWHAIDFKSTTETKRNAWTPEQIKAFFSLPLFTAYTLPQRAKRAGADAAYWIPLLGIFTGARAGELCQLRVVDIQQLQGIWCLDINEDGEGKQVKTESSKRKVPIHSKLVELGFLDYVGDTKQAGHVSLWPTLHLTPGKPSHGFSLWFNESPRKAVEGLEIPDFHSLRHTVRTAMGDAEVPEPDIDDIFGHKVKGSTGTKVYRHATLSKLQNAVERIQYPSFCLQRTYKPREKNGAS